MRPYLPELAISALSISLLTTFPAAADVFSFSTGNPDFRIATASRPDLGGVVEIESADDFVLTSPTSITSATFTGLLTGIAPSVDNVVVEIYRVFPKDSDVTRTSGSPDFSTSQVPTRKNSPSDVLFGEDRNSVNGSLTFSVDTVAQNVTASNSILNEDSINPKPDQNTGGDGPVTGTEVQFNVTFNTPFDLPADQYFFVPQIEVSGGEFLWLSAPRPIVSPGTPFPDGFTDLQSWIRDQPLQPDWLRIGADIVGGTTFNATFSLTGQTEAVPEPASIGLLGTALSAITIAGLRRRRQF